MIKNKEEFNKITTDMISFNQFLEQFKQEIFLSIPEIVIKHIQSQHEYKKIVDDFYIKHPDLKKDQVLIGSLANKISAENPGLSMEEVFKKTGIQARKILRNYDEKL